MTEKKHEDKKLLDWAKKNPEVMKRLEDQKKWEETRVKDEKVGKLLLFNDQLYIQKEECELNIQRGVYNVLSATAKRNKYKREIYAKEIKTPNPETGEPFTEEELKAEVIHADHLSRAHLRVIRQELAKLYVYVGRKLYDGSIVLTQEEYDGTYKNTLDQLQQLDVNLV